MKKVLAIISLGVVLLITGCGDKTADYEAIMEEYGRDYFAKYMPIVGFDEVEVTKDMLNTANESAGETYDLSKLDNCSDDTKVIFTLDSESGEIKSASFDLDCK
ncbi:MAG: hypothetical protein PHE54_00515 [Bacilli bacterium]|nr:hypothetical protein [Bacilli bacterium]